MTLQPAALIFPDAVLWACGALRPLLAARGESYAANVLVANAIPSVEAGGRRDRMVIFRRDGGLARGVLDNPRIHARVWGSSPQEAIDLARLVAALMWSLPGDGVCTRMAVLSGPSEVPDESEQPSVTVLFEAQLRGEAL